MGKGYHKTGFKPGWSCILSVIGFLFLVSCNMGGLYAKTPVATATASLPIVNITATVEPSIVPSLTITQPPGPKITDIIEQPTLTNSPTLTPTPTPCVNYLYSMQQGSPSYMPNIFYPEVGCSWLGVAGQIFDEKGNPAQGVIVEVHGIIPDEQIERLNITGGAPQYGPGGYEIVLADKPIVNNGQYSIRLLDLEGKELSESIVFETTNSCTQNLIIINFLSANYFHTRYYLPLTGNDFR
jgi:hypothetical protein